MRGLGSFLSVAALAAALSAVLSATTPALAADATGAENDWSDHYDFPSANSRQVTLNRALLIEQQKGGQFKTPVYNTTVYQTYDFQPGSNYNSYGSTAVGNQQIYNTENNCSGSATCTGGTGATQSNSGSSQNAQNNNGEGNQSPVINN